MKIGLISDTHNYLDPAVLHIFRGVDHILHGGDVGLMSILYALEDIAPVTAVFGNTDTDLPLKETEVVTLGTHKFLLQHIVDPRVPGPKLSGRIAKEQANVVVFGHTHKPAQERLGDTLYFNPGYAGKARFNLPRSVALMELGRGEPRIEIKWLS
jgi:putative phosphoesterase